MLFNSHVFVIFFVVVYALYLLLMKHHKLQNTLLLVASLIFYGYWDWSLLLLLLLSKTVNFTLANRIDKTEEPVQRKRYLISAIAFNLMLIGFFKYFNFFASSFVELLELFGIQPDWATLKIVLPMGISFYTFQLLSYIVDIYRKRLAPVRNFFDFILFVSFFPQLVAGPIERASDLVPQILSPRVLKADQINAGFFLIAWGFFKKIVIADNLKALVDPIFNGYTQYQGFDILIAILGFTFQIYCDFSGYSDIARGIAKLMGFELMLNFRLPYFALNPSDFWSRWHISLSSWLRDYLYIPLGGNRHGVLNTYRNLFITMLLGGLWHGAAWNFVIWGGYQGAILILYRIFEPKLEPQKFWNHSYFGVGIRMLVMFVLTNIGWVIFRSNSLHQMSYILTNIGFTTSSMSLTFGYKFVFFCLPLLLIQTYQGITANLLIITKLNLFSRISIYSFLAIWLLIFGARESGEFIYFQF
jgi:alginate O-acetyltransferase complex protein AlgI